MPTAQPSEGSHLYGLQSRAAKEFTDSHLVSEAAYHRSEQGWETKLSRSKYRRYSFNQLSEKAQERAIEDYVRSMDGEEWWEFTYEDAKRIGLVIEGFDLDHRSCHGSLNLTVEESVQLIQGEHGKDCDTYKLAVEYDQLCQGDRCAFLCNYPGEEWEENEQIREDYIHDLCREYMFMLDKEYQYLTSDQGAKDYFENNDTEFYKDGSVAR